MVPHTEDLVIQTFTVVTLWSQVVKVMLISLSSKVIQSLWINSAKKGAEITEILCFDARQRCYIVDVQNKLRLSPLGFAMVRRFGATLSHFWRPIKSDQKLLSGFPSVKRTESGGQFFKSPVNQSGLKSSFKIKICGF